MFRKSEKILLPIDDPELLCASPNMIKLFFGLPKWMQKKDYNENFDLYYEIVLKYFTFQGVVWFLEQDTQAMNTYFRKSAICLCILIVYLGISRAHVSILKIGGSATNKIFF